MQQPLPAIAVPPLPADGGIEVDLQAIFQRAYDAGPYQRELDYATASIDPPLTPRQNERLRQVLKIAGINRTRKVS